MDYEKLYLQYKRLYEDAYSYICILEEKNKKLEERVKNGPKARGRKVEIPFTLKEYNSLIEKGNKPEQIALKYGLSLRTLYRYIERLKNSENINKGSASVPIRISYSKYLELKEQGYLDTQIAEMLGVTPSKLNNFLNVVMKRIPEDRVGKFSMDEYLRLKEKGLPDYMIANEMGISPAKLSQRLKIVRGKTII